jgi:heme-degrading monooxygenase HmoA
MPGFIDVKSSKANDGARLTVVWWEDAETLKHWREQVRHRVAQRQRRCRYCPERTWTAGGRRFGIRTSELAGMTTDLL